MKSLIFKMVKKFPKTITFWSSNDVEKEIEEDTSEAVSNEISFIL